NAIELSLAATDDGYHVDVRCAADKVKRSHTIFNRDVQRLPPVGEYWEQPCRELFQLLFKEGTLAENGIVRANERTTVLLDIQDETLTNIPWEFACRSNLETTMLVHTHRLIRVVAGTFGFADPSELGRLHILVVAPDFYKEA